MIICLLPFLLASLLASGLPGVARAQELAVATTQTEREVGEIAAELDEIAQELANLRDADASLGPGLEQRLQGILDHSIQLSADATARAAQLQEQLAALGTPPAPGDPPEPPEIATKRGDVQETVSNLTVRSHAAAFLQIRADQMLQAVAQHQRAAVLDRILLTTPPAWNPAVWRDGLAQLKAIASWLAANAASWLDRYRSEGGLTALLQAMAAAGGAAAIATVIVRGLTRRLRGKLAAEADDQDVQALRRATGAVCMVAAPAAALLGVTLLWSYQGSLDGAFGAVLLRLAAASTLALLAVAMIRTMAANGGSSAAPALLTPAQAQAWPVRGYLLIALSFLTAVLKEAAFRQPDTPLAFLSVLAVIVALSGLALLLPLLFQGSWRTDGDRSLQRRRAILRGGLIVAAVGPTILWLLGHFVLATYLFDRTLATLALCWFLFQTRIVLRAAVKGLFVAPEAASPDVPAIEEEGRSAPARIGSYWACALLDAGLTLLTLKILLVVIDVPEAQVDYWTRLALGDVQVGNAIISLPNILLALVVLAVGLFIASRLRSWLGKSFLAQSGMEIGLRNSIAAGTGYLGMVLAVVAAIATAGISLSSLAIVAGALSVGMGFGLRTVVENFVAGLLMLIERPIRVGDWVVIGDTEGTVRKIAVRATEIETFDSASVIVPNSLFVSAPVTNWTLQNRRARLRIKLGVGYGSKTREVQEALLACARAHKQVAAFPAPQALFVDFGDSALLFELRCHVRDTDAYAVVRSELLSAIEQAMRERDIEIPFPQQVIHRGKGWESGEAAEKPPVPPIAIRPAS
jgi:potassium efflux system protein